MDTDRFTVSLDPDGTITGVTETVAARHSRWTNTATGASIVVSGHYLQVATRIPGTHLFCRTVTTVVSPVGAGRDGAGGADVGRALKRQTRDDSTWADLTGAHRFADRMLTDPAQCAAIA